ncbi:MFS transporter [Corynebacterium aquilae]|uniref:MFS transporter n=1 Tax=Corynebacterium aquilae TaxID=203263 RepID=UPI000AE8E928|nr:MFS transporter [Corynebacterium aquilae]
MSASTATPQPNRSVYAVAFACVIAFMGIGLVDPILPAISHSLNATPAQSMLLFTSYLFITSATMFFSSFISGKIGAKNTLLIGLTLIVAFAALAGSAGSIGAIINFRAGWGLGNALFISTALSTIVGACANTAQAIIMYEAALGIGIATGPLLGGFLGGISWRGPFYGTAALMLIGVIAIAIMLPGKPKKTSLRAAQNTAELHQAEAKSGGPAATASDLATPTTPPRRSNDIFAAFTALTHPGIRTVCLVALLYNFGFFTLLAYSPFPLEAAAHAAGNTSFGAHELGLIFFGWGTLLAITSVIVAPRLTNTHGHVRVLAAALITFAIILGIMALEANHLHILIACVIIAGAALGIVNTVMTEVVMEVSDLPRPVASSTYSGIRFLGGAISPIVAGALRGGQPYLAGALAVITGVIWLFANSKHLQVHHN